VKLCIFPLALLIAASSMASQSVVLAVKFEKTKKTHIYKMTMTASAEPEYTLTFTNEKRKTESRTLNRLQAEQFLSEATSIIWDTLFKKQPKSKTCHLYMIINTDSDKAKICYEDPNAVKRSFGFISQLFNAVHSQK
jgi:hypothetical protein